MKTNQTEIILIRPLRAFTQAGRGYGAPSLTAGRLYPATHATNQPDWKAKGKIFVAFNGAVPDGESDSILLDALDYDRVYPDFPVEDYLAAALWTMPDMEAGSGEFTESKAYRSAMPRITRAAWRQARNDCNQFLSIPGVWEDLERSGLSPKKAAHDFWLSRNGHGSGFFDEISQTTCADYGKAWDKAVVTGDFSERNALTDTCPCAFHACERLQRAAETMVGSELSRRGGWYSLS